MKDAKTNANRAVGNYRAMTFALSLPALVCMAMPAARAQYPAQYPSEPQVKKDGTAVLIRDYASLPPSDPVSDSIPKPVIIQGQLNRINFLRSEPAGAPRSTSRFFVNNMDGSLYILDKKTKKITPYLNLAAIFPKFTFDPAYEGGFAFVAFDPDYAKNGKFYTSHTEKPTLTGSAKPTNSRTPGLNLDGYATTAAIPPRTGEIGFESVVVEWTDTNIKNDTFEGTAREVLRVGFNTTYHQIEDMTFDPVAKSGGSDYRNLYISVGDGADGETAGERHATPQSLDAAHGKILRITPDIDLRPGDKLGANGRYRVPSTGPDPNPFVTIAGARPEIFAYGFRNPQRLTWDKPTNTFIADDIGLSSWEEVDIVKKGANYGYAEREGNEALANEERPLTGSRKNPPVPFPVNDSLTVAGLNEPVTPMYPAAVLSHQDSDSIGSGFVYRGSRMPALQGKYIFNDITSGRIFYIDLAEMLAGQGMRNKQATVHELQIVYKSPYDKSATVPVKRRMYDIVADAYAHKGGALKPNVVLPSAATIVGGYRGDNYVPGKVDPYGVPYGGGRADIRIAAGGDGELYIVSKSDGMIREFVSVVTPPPASK